MWYSVILLWIVRCVDSTQNGRELLVQKCCAHGEQIVMNDMGVGTCEGQPRVAILNYTYQRVADILARDPSEPSDFDWLPGGLPKPGTDDLWVKYSQWPRCPRGHTLFLSSKETSRYRLGDKTSLILMTRNTGGHIVEVPFSNHEYCVDKAVGIKGPHVYLLCPCGRVKCVQKCCAEGYVLHHDSKIDCKIYANSTWEPFADDSPSKSEEELTYDFLDGQFPQCKGKVVLTDVSDWPDHFVVSWFSYPDGRLFKDDNVCADLLFHDNAPLTHALVSCSIVPPFRRYLETRGALHVLASTLLFCGLVALITLHELRSTIHGMLLTCHTFSHFISNVLLSNSFLSDHPLFPCTVLPFIVYYFMNSAAAWLSIIAYNITVAFRNPTCRGSTEPDPKATWSRFGVFSVYAWGFPAALTGFTYFMWAAPGLPRDTPRPTLQETRTCYYETRSTSESGYGFIYFYGPLAAMLIFNTTLFISTAWQIHSWDRDSDVLREGQAEIKACMKKSAMYLRLVMTFGVSEFIIELITWASSPNNIHAFEIIVDCVDLGRAVSIFVLCCMKKKILQFFCQLRCPVGLHTWQDRLRQRRLRQQLQEQQQQRHLQAQPPQRTEQIELHPLGEPSSKRTTPPPGAEARSVPRTPPRTPPAFPPATPPRTPPALPPRTPPRTPPAFPPATPPPLPPRPSTTTPPKSSASSTSRRNLLEAARALQGESSSGSVSSSTPFISFSAVQKTWKKWRLSAGNVPPQPRTSPTRRRASTSERPPTPASSGSSLSVASSSQLSTSPPRSGPKRPLPPLPVEAEGTTQEWRNT